MTSGALLNSKEDLRYLLGRLGIRSCQNGITLRSYDQILGEMTRHMLKQGFNAQPGSAIGALLEAVAKGIVLK